MLHDRLLDAMLYVVPTAGTDAGGLYASLLDLAGRLLEDLANGRAGADAGWCGQVLQVQVPAMREAASITLAPPLESELDPLAELEIALRERYGVPAPDA